MGKIKKKGEAGNAKNYITRSQAVRKLQISLPDFRKLCIWKGIFPREPRNKKKVSKSSTPSTTFYYAKDIQYLLHEPLLQKFRDQKALEKKISKALGRGDVGDAKRLETNAARPEKTGKPRYTLNHVIRERYPTFVDAIRDLDDCLSMLFLFANLPSTSTVPAKMIARCEKLCLEFQHYLIVSQSLRKSFLSIKGIYYQANIQGEDVLWLAPYKFNQRVVGDVDFRIMGTFVEFYMTLLGFINFRLYTSVGLKYPPKFDETKDDQAAELAAFKLESTRLNDPSPSSQIANGESQNGPDPKTQAAVNKLIRQMKDDDTDDTAEAGAATETQEELSTDAIDKFEPVVPGGDVLPQPNYSESDSENLFANCTFFLSREAPRQPLEFILRAFGCKRIGWDAVLGEGAFTTNERDPSITHQIVDRPVVQAAVEETGDGEDNQTSQKLAPNQRMPGRVYIQPQWVWDSINDGELKRPDQYAPGAQLPPHLSPFVQQTQGAYDPTIPLEDQQPEDEALEDSDGEVDDDDLAVKRIEDGAEGMDIASDDDEDDGEEEDGDKESFGGFSEEDDDDDKNDEVDDEEDAEMQYQRELEAELTGKPVKRTAASTTTSTSNKAKAEARKKLAQQAREEAEELERQKGMLSKKKRKLFEQMQYTNNKKSTEDKALRAKRRKLEKEKAKAGKA